MQHVSIALAVLTLFPLVARAEDSLPPKMVTAIKAATVFVKIEVEGLSGSGSGFVVATQRDTAYIVTNRHVVEPEVAAFVMPPDTHSGQRKHGAKKSDGFPRIVVHSYKNASVTVVFQSGTKLEESLRGEVVAADPEQDLAVIKVTGVKQLPNPIDFVHEPKLSETMPIYTFGFPFGKVLSINKGSPAITVGKGSVSSLRMDDAGNLALVQIDGALNPGNSGGPVVDVQGRLVGVAVAIIRGSNNIGFAIPAGEVSKILKGHLGKVVFDTIQGDGGETKLRVKADLIDPLNKIKSADFFYLAGDTVQDKPKPADPLAPLPGCRSVKLKIENRVAVGTIPLKQGIREVSLLHQTAFIYWEGKPSTLRVTTTWEAVQLRQPGVGATDCSVTYHSAQLRMVKGKATWVDK